LGQEDVFGGVASGDAFKAKDGPHRVLDDIEDTNGLRWEVGELEDGTHGLIHRPLRCRVGDMVEEEPFPKTLGCVIFPRHTRDVRKVTLVKVISTTHLIHEEGIVIRARPSKTHLRAKNGFGLRPFPFEIIEEHGYGCV
jgi:hypothetical protein